MRYVVTGFLQDDCVCGIPARWSWIPLRNGETLLMMHEVMTKSSRFGLPNTDHKQDHRPWL